MEFRKALQAERDQIAPHTLENAELIAARQVAADALAELVDWREKNRNVLGGRSHDERGHNLTQAEYDARNLVGSQESARQRAVKRVAEIDSLLHAESEATAERQRISALNKTSREAQSRSKQLAKIDADLQSEIAELGEKRSAALRTYGTEEIAARVAGKTLAAPKAIATIDSDIESRNAALAAVASAKEEAKSQAASATEELRNATARYRHARARCIELEYYEQLPSILPILAMLKATGSQLSWTAGPNEFTLNLDPQIVAAAEQALANEIAEA